MLNIEREGLSWLEKNVKEGRIAITLADKGGSVIITTPDVIRDITRSKLSDQTIYTNLGGADPLQLFGHH